MVSPSPPGPVVAADDWHRNTPWALVVVGRLSELLPAGGVDCLCECSINTLVRRPPLTGVWAWQPDASSQVAGHHEFAIVHRWSLPGLAGYIRSTSLLPASVLGDHAVMFDAEADQARLQWMQQWGSDVSGHAIVQSTRPQTLAYSLTDSPVGQLAWIVEKFKEWTNPAAELPEDAVDRDLMLTDVSIYWHTRTAGSAARIYREDAATWGQTPQRSPVPTGVAVFPGDITLRPLAERHHNLVRWTEYQQGGHFPALEVPELLVEDVRTFFRGLR